MPPNHKTIKLWFINLLIIAFITAALIEGYVAFSLSYPEMSFIPPDSLNMFILVMKDRLYR